MIKALLLACALGGAALSAAETPTLFGYSAPYLAAAKASLARGEERLQPALARLKQEADRALRQKARSVMDKPLTAASGDRHDYFTYGPYWWPDPVKPNGLPYIKRDGDVNPASRDGTDAPAITNTFSSIATLSLAYYFTGDERYADKAAQYARVWFLDPATRMNPNLEYAQAIPGVSKGRGIGIIEARRLGLIADSLALLDGSTAWTEGDRAGFINWLKSYYRWLTTSANGRDERGELNNHGTFFDAQCAHLALVLGQRDEARKILQQGLKRRLSSQIEPDGSQPRELVRTKSLSYSLFNLEALFECARLGESVGVDWWGYSTKDGRSLHTALAYLAPYMDPAKPWIKHDLKEAERTRLPPLIAQYLLRRDDAELRALYARFPTTSDAADRWHLLYPGP